jgi:vacuolar-type H+-ATPase subunit H
MQIIKQREKPVDAMQEKINPMHNKADQLLDPAQKEAKLKEIKKADKELDCLFQSSRKVQGQLRQLRPVALERYTALQ